MFVTNRILPVDAHVKCTGRLHVSLTCAKTGKNVIFNTFNSNEDLIQVYFLKIRLKFDQTNRDNFKFVKQGVIMQRIYSLLQWICFTKIQKKGIY